MRRLLRRRAVVAGAREALLGAMAEALASLAFVFFAGSWRRRVREQFGLDAATRQSSEIAIPPKIGAQDEYDNDLYRYAMRQDTALWASS